MTTGRAAFLLCPDQNGLGAYWTPRVVEGFAALGVAGDIHEFDYSGDMAEVGRTFSRVLASSPRFVYCVNFRPEVMAQGPDGALAPGLSFLSCPVFIQMGDHPAWLWHNYLSQRLPARPIIGLIDGAHRSFLDTMGHGQGLVVATPLAGRAESGPLPATAERDIPLLMMGDLPGEAAMAAFLDEMIIRCANDGWTRAVELSIAELLEQAPAQARTVQDIFVSHAIARMGGNISQDLFAAGCLTADRISRAHRRRRLLRSFTRIGLHVVGRVEDEVLAQRTNVTLLGARPVGEVCALTRRARLCLGDNLNFTEGLADRTILGLEHGAVVVTRPNALIARDFAHGDSMVFVDYDDPRLEQAVMEGMAGDLDSMRARAARILAARHSWHCRARVIMDAVTRLENL